jgi:hypothetical protein
MQLLQPESHSHGCLLISYRANERQDASSIWRFRGNIRSLPSECNGTNAAPAAQELTAGLEIDLLRGSE